MKQDSFDPESQTLLIVNPSANRGRATRVGEEIGDALSGMGVNVKKVIPATIAATRELVKEVINFETRVIAVGGDRPVMRHASHSNAGRGHRLAGL